MALRTTATARLTTARTSSASAPVRAPLLRAARPARVVRMAASGEQQSEAGDFDAFIMKLADKFEKSENKPAVVGYSAAALGAFFFAEWLIHLPGLDILLGFPVQLVGLLSLPFLALRWYVDGKDATSDIGDVVTSITKKLPGLEKK